MPTRLEDVPPELITDFDITDPALSSPHAALAALQEKTPVAYSPLHGGYWIVTRYDDVHAVVRDWETFSNTQNQVPVVAPVPSIPLQIDPPEHKLYRQILNPLFNPTRMRALEEAIRGTTTSLIDGFAARGHCDVVQELAHPLTMATFVSLMEWPLEDGERFTEWTEAILVGKPGAPAEEDAAVRQKANEEVFAYFTGVIADRRGGDGQDPTSQIVNAEFEGRPLTDDELLRMFWLLMLGGLHTVRGVLGLGLIHLVRNPRERQRLIDDPSLLGAAVEELLRIEAPVAGGRVVTRETTLQGVTLQPGDMVLVMLSAANRDPREFPAPDELRIDRSQNRHLAFSGGPHRCVGSHLARIELSVALREILRRIPGFVLDPEHTPELHHSQVRGINSLRIRFTPEAS
ncbi:cytochrome P450 [Pseudonocardia yuanmonensis]|uniref:Cytochrome P450 n=1 Tax=Pseudonocardia yuanmonensis TaxID=1095914 RepID=A0ABP8XMD4_9PSEU